MYVFFSSQRLKLGKSPKCLGLFWSILALFLLSCNRSEPPEIKPLESPEGGQEFSLPESEDDSEDRDSSRGDIDSGVTEVDLETSSQTELEESMSLCADENKYFDIVQNVCTERLLMELTCTRENVLEGDNELLAANQKTQIASLLDSELKDYKLHACIDDGEKYSLIVLKVEEQQGAAEKKVLRELKVPK